MQNSFGQIGLDAIKFKNEKGEFTLFSAYFWLIAIIITAFFVWALPIQSCLRIVRHCCYKKFRPEGDYSNMNYSFEEDFYKCISFTALKEKLI